MSLSVSAAKTSAASARVLVKSRSADLYSKLPSQPKPSQNRAEVEKALIYTYLHFYKIKKNEMGWACGAYGGGERCAQGFGGDA
jgi:hypothetical protein